VSLLESRREFLRRAAALAVGGIAAEVAERTGWVRRLFPVGIELRSGQSGLWASAPWISHPTDATEPAVLTWGESGSYLRTGDMVKVSDGGRLVKATGREPMQLIVGAAVWRELQRDPSLLERVFGG